MIFIYDRNLLDIATAKEIVSKIQSNGFSSLTEYEKQQWSNGLKGTLNFNDMNRIKRNILEVSKMVGAEIVEPFTEWSMETLPTRKDFERIRHNTELIREKASVSNTPYVPELPLNRYDKINDIEKILFDAYLIASPEVPQYYIDEIYIDEEIGDI